MEKVAVILPVYIKDNPLWLNDAVSSIVHQSYHDIKLFVGLDGPVTEEQMVVLNGFADKFNLKIVPYKENRGMAAVLNDLLMLAMSEGFEFFARMDADDIAEKDRISIQMAYLQSHQYIDVVGGSVSWIDENGKEMGIVVKRPETPKECRKYFAKRNPLPHPGVLFHKSFFDKAGCLYRKEYKKNQDTLLWYDGLMKNVQIANVPEVILWFRITDAQIKNRRSGWKAAKKQFIDRLMINKGLHYGIGADIYAFCVFVLMLSPSWLRWMAYKIRK